MNPFWNRSERRPRALWRIVAFLVLRVALLVGVVSLARVASGSTAPSWRAFLRGLPPDRPTSAPLAQGLELIAALAATAFACAVLDRRSWKRLGLSFRRPLVWADLAAGLVIGCAAIAAVGASRVALGLTRFTGWLPPVPSAWTLTTWLGAGLLACALNGLEEELADGRAYFVTNVVEGLRDTRLGVRGALVAAVLLGSLLFGLAHLPGGRALAFYTGCVGALLALGYVLTGELALAIGLHTSWNYAQVNLSNLDADAQHPIPTLLGLTSAASGAEGDATVLLGVAVGVALTLAWVRLSRGRVALPIERWSRT